MIQTQDQLTQAMAGQNIQGFLKAGTAQPAAGYWFSRWMNAGRPGAGAAPAVGLNGEQVSRAFAGAVAYSNAATGKQKYLSGLELQATGTGAHVLYDRLWQNSGLVVTTTTAQPFVAVPIPARDLNGAGNGHGVEPWLEVYVATGNAAAISTGASISYTNEQGVAGRTGIITTIPLTTVAGTSIPITLQSGDQGVRSVDSVTLGTTLVSGSVGIVLRRRLASINMAVGNQGDFRGFMDIGQKLHDDMALEFLQLSISAAAQHVFGSVMTIEG